MVVGGDYTNKMHEVQRIVDNDIQSMDYRVGGDGNYYGFGLLPESIFVFRGPYTGLAGDVERNKKIGHIDLEWGDRFRITFDLIIHSHIKRKWASVISVISLDSGRFHAPGIQLHRKGFLRITAPLNGNKFRKFIFKVELGRWYNIRIQQVNWMHKVNEGVLREGKTSNIKSMKKSGIFPIHH